MNPSRHPGSRARPDRRVDRSRWPFALVLLAASACSRLLGDVELETVVEPASAPPRGPAGGSAGAAVGASGEEAGNPGIDLLEGPRPSGIEGTCGPGNVRCSGAAL